MSMTTPRVTVPVDVVAACKGEQEHFEAWAKLYRYDLSQHPLHYIFTDPKTDAARMGWKAALAYVHDAAEPLSAAPAPVEDLAGKLKAIRDKFLMPTPDKDFTDYAIMTRCVEALSAAPAPEGVAKGPGGYLVKDFADGWYWTPNAALDHASGAPVWSVADGRYETDPTALATREEAPAEAGEIEEIFSQGHNFIATCKECGVAFDAHLRGCSNVRPTALRSQPPAREDAQPVASAYRVRPEMNDPEEWTLMHPERAFDYLDRPGWETQPLYTHPAPDALRLAVEALEPFAAVMADIGESEDDADSFRNPRRDYAKSQGISVGHIRRASQALAALQAEQKGSA